MCRPILSLAVNIREDLEESAVDRWKSKLHSLVTRPVVFGGREIYEHHPHCQTGGRKDCFGPVPGYRMTSLR